MILCSLRLHNMRAHAHSTLKLEPGINLLHGSNGAGKTNILEAIHYLCLSKSFLTPVDRYVVRHHEAYFEIEGRFTGSIRQEVTLRTVFSTRQGKRIFMNGVPLEKLSDIVGVVPIVVFSPRDQGLTLGGPDERRKFLDSMLSQTRQSHLEDLIEYRRALGHRNKYLSQNRHRQVDPVMMTSLNTTLARSGGRIVALRANFLQTFNDFLKHAWEQLGEAIEEPKIGYQTSIPDVEMTSEETATEALLLALEQSTSKDQELGRTTIGPHRDELVFKLDGQRVRGFASTGQHRSYVIALKLAQYHYLDSRLEEKPVLLLDDLFDYLDRNRTEVILDWLRNESTGQSFLTTADARRLRPQIQEWGAPNQCIKIHGGKVIQDHPEGE